MSSTNFTALSGEQSNFLQPDPPICQVSGQRFALVSFVSPQSNQKHDKIAMKIRGVFATTEEAGEKAKQLQKMDSLVDIYVVELYNWVPVPPSPDDIQDQVHQDQMLNELIQGHTEQQKLAQEEFQSRKDDMLRKNEEDNEKKQKDNVLLNEAALQDEDPWLKSKNEGDSKNVGEEKND